MTDITVILQGQSLVLGQMITALHFFCRSYTFQGHFYTLATQKVLPSVYIFSRSKVIIDNLYFHLLRSIQILEVQISKFFLYVDVF